MEYNLANCTCSCPMGYHTQICGSRLPARNCGQDECLPARQFNREVELHTAREEWIAKYHRDFNAALEGYLGALFGGER